MFISFLAVCLFVPAFLLIYILVLFVLDDFCFVSCTVHAWYIFIYIYPFLYLITIVSRNLNRYDLLLSVVLPSGSSSWHDIVPCCVRWYRSMPLHAWCPYCLIMVDMSNNFRGSITKHPWGPAPCTLTISRKLTANEAAAVHLIHKSTGYFGVNYRVPVWTDPYPCSALLNYINLHCSYVVKIHHSVFTMVSNHSLRVYGITYISIQL